jgi:hypothetical protein
LIIEGRIPEIRAGRRKRLYRKSALLKANSPISLKSLSELAIEKF